MERLDILCKATTLKMKPRDSTSTTTGSTFNPGDSSVYSPNQPRASAFEVFRRLWRIGQLWLLSGNSRVPFLMSMQPFAATVTEDRVSLLSIVLLLPPAPAALVLVGRAFATLSALSAAAFLRIAVLAPPGGDEGRAVLVPVEGGELTGELGRGEDCRNDDVSNDF